MNPRSNFTFEIFNFENHKVISIIDENRGRMSVTNDIENVVEQIASQNKIDPDEHRIIYRDSDGTWDGWNNKQQIFIHLGCKDELTAVKKAITIHENKDR